MKQTISIVEKINEVKNTVPNWADQVAARMNKPVYCIRAYARGERGLKKGYPLAVLKHLNEIRAEHATEIETELNR